MKAINKKRKATGMRILAAAASALFAAVTAIFAKVGVKTTDSDVATAVRTTLVLTLLA